MASRRTYLLSVSQTQPVIGPETVEGEALATHTVTIPLRAPITNVVPTVPAASDRRFATSPCSISNVVNLTPEFTACLPITGAVPLQNARMPSFSMISLAILAMPGSLNSAPRLLASIILVFRDSAGVTTRIDSAVPAVTPASIVAVFSLKISSDLNHSTLLENAKNLTDAFSALLVARAVHPAYSPEMPWVPIVERRREKDEGGEMTLPLGSWRRVLTSSKGY
ncbi:hypothetical protein ACN38_g12708 [Penicillium nordicum]|uniref:Uncharacterized protein n=1 Tax=Penicillium nordicum TaxID=229535 RepID=A0A0M9WA06_9EURO|nr:hypothetical protein ACN38_g12708 [Penicillium nordicum]